MSGHASHEIPQLLSGEADRGTVISAAAHLRACEDCRDELISATVAHAALMSAVRFAPGVGVANEPAELHEQVSAPTPDAPATYTLYATSKRPAPKILGYRWLAAAALITVGAAVAVADHGNSHVPSARSVALDAFDQGTNPASAELVGNDTMKLDAASLPTLASGQYYEVWLTNDARTAMAPVGPLDSAGDGDFTVPIKVLNGYDAIEVSIQSTHARGDYSGVSVLRGSYA